MPLLQSTQGTIETIGVAGALALTIAAVIRWMMSLISKDLRDSTAAVRELTDCMRDAIEEEREFRRVLTETTRTHDIRLDELARDVRALRGGSAT